MTAPVADGGYGLKPSETHRIFSVWPASFATVMLFAGRRQATIGPRQVAAIGGMVLGLGYILGGIPGSSFRAQFICIGIIGGVGIGLAYVVQIAVCVKSSPDNKGLITGSAIAGSGMGATIPDKTGRKAAPFLMCASGHGAARNG